MCMPVRVMYTRARACCFVAGEGKEGFYGMEKCTEKSTGADG